MSNLPQNAYLHKGDRPAGNPDSNYVLTIQGVTGGEAIPITPSAAVVPTEDSADGTIGQPIGTVVILVGAKDNNGNYAPLQINSSGQLIVDSAATGVGLLNATGQVSVGTGSTQIIAANTSRSGVLITNPSSTVTVYIGNSGLTTSTGAILPPSSSLTLPVTSAIYGIVASSTQTVSYVEVV
jgi:hypothetical protein